MSRAHRGTIFLEEAEVLANDHHAAGQHVLRMRSPVVAARAEPGAFVHLRCGPPLAMRRPMSVMRTEPAEGWFELLFKEVGAGTGLLARCERGDRLSVLGPIGNGFSPTPERPRRLLLGGGVGIPPILFLAERLVAARPVVLMGSEVPFPFDLRPSAMPEAGLPAGAALGCLEDVGVPSRTASRAGLPGCFDGLVTDLARNWLRVRFSLDEIELRPSLDEVELRPSLDEVELRPSLDEVELRPSLDEVELRPSLDEVELRPSLDKVELRPSLDKVELRPSLDKVELRPSLEQVELFACGPEPMLRVVAELGREFGVPSQLALEEHMACGTGGCAGCNVLVQTPSGPAMKRVCVDGPVFDGASVFGE